MLTDFEDYFRLLCFIHRLNNKINRQKARCRLLNIQGFFIHNNPETEAQAALNYKTERENALPARNSFGLLPQGYCERKTP